MPFFSRMILASVTFWMPGPLAIFLPASSAIDLTGLSLGTTNSSSTSDLFEGLEQIILNRLGLVISASPSTAEAVPLAEPWMRPEIMASATCCALANFTPSTFSPASLKMPRSRPTYSGRPEAMGQ
jgi:hypothetical protein